jgi:hypothetical protein
MSKELLDWIWWYLWGDEEEENPSAILPLMWAVWERIDQVRFWAWVRFFRHLERWFDSIWYRFFPLQLRPPRLDRDGRSPEEWLLIGIVGAWQLYQDDYDQQVKANWDAFVTNQPESNTSEDQRSTTPQEPESRSD